MKKLIFLLLPIFGMSQVGINTTTPEPGTALHIAVGAGGSTLKIDNIPLVTTADYVLVTTANGVVKKVLLSSLMGNQFTCPTFIKNSSNPFYVLFSSASSIPNPNNSITVNGINFTQSGSWISNNTYFYSWTNFTGTPLTGNSIIVNFGNNQCTYAN